MTTEPSQSTSLALDHPVDEELSLTTVEGVEDFLVQELTDARSVDAIRRGRGEVSCHVQGSLQELHQIRLYATAALVLSGSGEGADHVELVGSLRRSLERGVLSALTEPGPMRFRVGTPSAEIMHDLIGLIERELGWVNDPSAWEVNFGQSDGRWVAQIGSLHWARRFGRLARLPWSTTPLIGEVMARMVKPQTGTVVLDPCCGTATLLVAVDRLAPGCVLHGTDRDAEAITRAKENLTGFGVDATVEVRDAVPIAHAPGTVDRVISNLPFGKRVGSHQENARLYPHLMNELARVLSPTGRAVLLTEDKRLLVDSVSRTKGLKIVRDRLLSHGGATPTAYVLTRTRR